MNITPWAARFLGTVPKPIPSYGTPTWEALEPGDPARLAAVVVAAELWREHCTAEAIAERLRAELELSRSIYAERMREACNDARGPRRVGRYADGTTYVPLGAGPSYAELERRRRE